MLFAAVVVLFAPAVFALGLGELNLQSALNQQFKAEIKLTNLRGLQIDEVIPNLASQSDFDRVGVERGYLLTDLRFKVVQADGGDLIIHVTSNKLIVEPFLNFIVEVLWPNGRILREYTTLLDPPIFSESRVEAITASEAVSRTPISSQSSKSGRSVNQSTSDLSSSRQVIETSPQALSSAAAQVGEVKDDEYGVTGAGDTLWTIALNARPNKSVTVQQTMLALQRANPEAFINNNINLLKAGYVLRLPSAREIREGSISASAVEVRVQNEAFDVYKKGSVAQLDGTGRSSNNDARGQGESSGELKLLASNQSSGERAGEGSSVRSQELENNLAVAEEDLDRARRANTEMSVRLDDLQDQLETLTEILTLKDDQLAALSAELKKIQSSTPATSGAAATEVAVSPSGDSNLMTTIASVVGGIVVLLVAIGSLIFMRRRQQATALDDEFVEESLEDEIDEEEEETDSELDSENQNENVDQDEDQNQDEDEDSEEEVTQETNDVISEVEIYIAYGRFPQSITFLQNAIEAEPNRADIQLKLLEVYVQTEDSVAFNLQLEQLKLLEDDEAMQSAMALQQNIPGAAEEAAASMDATIISSEPMIAIEEPEDDDDDLSFDLDDLDSETEDDELNLSDELDLDLDLELSLDDEDEDEFSLDLDDDNEVSLDLDGEDEISLDLDDDDEISLDLDDEDEFSLDLDDDEEISLDLDGENVFSLDLDDDGEISLDLDDDDDFSLDLDEDEGNKLDLARAYIDMGDAEGARSVLKDVLASGVENDIKEANELLEKID